MTNVEEVAQIFEERELAKSYCRRLIVMRDKDTKVIQAQEKEIERLTKSYDPKREKALAEILAKARAAKGMKDIEEYMSKNKDS